MNLIELDKFIDEEKNYSGIDLFIEVEDPYPFVNRAETQLMEFVKNNNPNIVSYEQLPSLQKQCFRKALLEQVYYLHTAGDVSIILGYDPVTNTSISVDEIRKREISHTAKIILENSGLLYCGIKAKRYGVI